jgi:hypothetical protein
MSPGATPGSGSGPSGWARHSCWPIASSGQGLLTAYHLPDYPGGMLQDYFTELCFCLKKDDMKILKKRE